MKSSITLVYIEMYGYTSAGWMFKSSGDLIHRKISKFYDLCWFQLEITKVFLLCRDRIGVSKTQGCLITVCLQKS